MLKTVRISNFLSCEDTEIELDNVTALIGRNAAGKTNILKAIEWCAQFAVGNGSLYEQLQLGPFDVLGPECDFEFLIDDQIFKYERKVTTNPSNLHNILIENLWCYTSDDWELIAERSNDSAMHYFNKEAITIEIKSEAPMISSMLSFLPKKTLNPSINKIFDYLSGVSYYTLDDEYRNSSSNSIVYGDNSVIYGNDYKHWLSKNNEEKSSVVMRLLHLWHDDKETLDELLALIGANGLNLVNNIFIKDFEWTPEGLGQKKSQDYLYIVRFNTENASVSYSQLSYGTRRVLTLLLALLYDKNSTLLIEQPEDGIHSGLLKKLLPLCFEYATVYNKQIIIATHSPDVINLLPPESIRLVRMTEKGTKVAALNKDQIPMIRDYMKHEGALFDFIKSMNDE